MALLFAAIFIVFDMMAETQMTVDMDTEQFGMLLTLIWCPPSIRQVQTILRGFLGVFIFKWYVETMTIDKEWGNLQIQL